MKERPILFSGEMVRAILEGRKTQTRRVIKPQPTNMDYWSGIGVFLDGRYGFVNSVGTDHFCPYGQPGDRLWVRETWGICPDYNQVRYKADKGSDDRDVLRWKPSIHMFRKYSRINLEITNIKVERLQDISVIDVSCEGIQIQKDWFAEHAIGAYKELWEKINGSGSWDKNPFVWVVEFKRI